ncbi:ferredoxin [Kosmotoga arenicorallina S304]|uniref:Ferredoxin n=1 Tax=Kosmotoga arenicorallina S304 TaxID=1453497 RepID=A0A176K2A9_9BACT|nr:NAD(P)/FAD-dependent oxidoreductase [Kosmotoga arenicorallina]OAA31187.1 ferredoxin [Kosmotoga arenicorallina S304]
MKIAIIGGGVIGSLLAYELSHYEVNIVLIEKNHDFGLGVTKANSAIVHGGYDDPPGSLRAELCYKGNQLYEELAEKLKIPLKRTGSFVVARNCKEDLEKLEELLSRGEKNGVKGIEVVGRDFLEKYEPYLSEEFEYALHCPHTGITEPWMVAITAVKEAEKSGAELVRGDAVVGGEVSEGKVKYLQLKSGRKIEADIIINAAGLYYHEVANIFGVPTPQVYLRKGQYILLDHKASEMVKHIIFPLPSEKGKGKLVVPTIDGGVLLGPTSENLPEFTPEDVSTTLEGIKEVIIAGNELVPGIAKPNWIIKSFAGLRPETQKKDFFIENSDRVRNFVTVGAIRSPGLTAAPSIARYVIEEILERRMSINLTKRVSDKKSVPDSFRVKESDLDEIAAKIRNDEKYGRIICQCNQVSEAEIIKAIHEGARSIDGVKFRTRAGFGRCQGGFCTWKIAKILARELKIQLSEVRLNEEGTALFNGKVRV